MLQETNYFKSKLFQVFIQYSQIQLESVECSYYEYYESDNSYADVERDKYEDQYEDQYSDDFDNDDQYIYDSDCGNSEDDVTFQDIRDFDEGLGISEADNDDSEVIYKRQYLDGSSDSESEDEYTKSSVAVKHNDSRSIEQEFYEYNNYGRDSNYSSVSHEVYHHQHGGVSFKGKKHVTSKYTPPR